MIPATRFNVERLGCRLGAAVSGDGPQVLFIQGCGVEGEGWRPQTDALSRDYQCLWFDNRDIERSLPIGAAVSVEQMTEDALAVMDSLSWEDAHVIKHSLSSL